MVCDGFVGNVILKTSESLAERDLRAGCKRELKKDLDAHGRRAAGARRPSTPIRRRTNTEEYGGMPLLGVNGICIKAHGNSSPKAIKNAIRVAREAVTHKVNPQYCRGNRPA